MKKINGFALLDVLLAVILVAIAAYGTFKVAKSFKAASSVQQLEQNALNIAQSYSPYLADANTKLVVGDAMDTAFLASIAIPNNMMVSPGSETTYLYSGVYSGSATCEVNFSEADETNGASYLIMGVTLSGGQYNQLLQDLSGSFSVFRSPNADSPISSTGSVTGLVSESSASGQYSVFLIYPKSGNKPPTQGSFTPKTCGSS